MPPKVCVHCGGPLPPRKSRYCSDVCRRIVRAEVVRRRYHEDVDYAERVRARGRIVRRSCKDCGTDLGLKRDRETGPRWCDVCSFERKRASGRRKNVKRRGARRGLIKFTVAEIGDRDRWRCHLCRRPVDRKLPGTHSRGPTIDHLVPLAAGGLDEPSNVGLAHRACNVKRRDKGTAQLRLLG